jgi:hypothetical protein
MAEDFSVRLESDAEIIGDTGLRTIQNASYKDLENTMRGRSRVFLI